MLEKEQRYVDALRSELAKSNTSKVRHELTSAEKRVRTMQDQLFSLTGVMPDQPPPMPSIPPASAVLAHHRTKSSPDPIGLQNYGFNSTEGINRRLSSSESISDLTPKRPKPLVGWDLDPQQITPPGTPPPPYGSSSLQTETIDSNMSTHPEEDSAMQEESPASPDLPAMHSVPSPANSMASPPDVKMPFAPLPPQQQAYDTPPDMSPVAGPMSWGKGQKSDIISMEDDNLSDQEVNSEEDHGPFNSLSKLWQNNAHLAVFMNYVMCNSDPTSLLFYLTTDLYKEGNAKEMKKWAYEIHSSFLVPGAPLRINTIEEQVIIEIDKVLQNELDKEEILRKVFWKARAKAKEELNEQLADFCTKRTAGLGTLFGPADAQLDESMHDKAKEMKIVEYYLGPCLETLSEDIDNATDRTLTMASAVATVLSKTFGVRSQQASNYIERCPTFVTKDKSLKSKFLSKNKKQFTIQNHHFVAHQYFSVTFCNHCQNVIWGIGPQGYQCTNCEMNVHKTCVRVVEEICIGPSVKKEKGNDRISRLMDRIRNPDSKETRRKPSQLIPAQIEKAKRQMEERDGAELGLTHMDGEQGAGERLVSPGGKPERRPDTVKEGEDSPQDGGPVRPEEEASVEARVEHQPSQKKKSTAISRSESLRTQRRQTRGQRKSSDPNLPPSKNSDVELDSQTLSYNNSGSSSNSSLSTSQRSLDSPSNSLEMVTSNRTSAASDTVTSSITLSHGSALWDSDIETEPDPPDWQKGIEESIIKQLKPKEKKRQDVINEFFHTEKSHVRNLKVLERIFYRPLLDAQMLTVDQIQLMFSNLEEVLEVHGNFSSLMQNRKKDNPIVGDIGDILSAMFEGSSGENLQRAAAAFCRNQSLALDVLKEKRKKDQKFNNFLCEAESNSVCRRLQLKDIIPMGMTRLTKYPLLLENLAKYTPPGSEEHLCVKRCLERSRDILNYVNQAVKDAEHYQRLQDIQKKLDKSAFEKLDHPLVNEFRNLDLTKHKLIYEGALTWKISNRQKTIDLQVLLLEDLILLLQKQDDKYILKFHSITMYTTGREDNKLTHSPIIKFSTVLIRAVATDKKAFFLVNTSPVGAQIYELVAATSAERKTWFRHISEAAEAYKKRDGKNRLQPDHSSPSSLSLPAGDGESSETPTEKAKEPEEPSEATSEEAARAGSESAGVSAPDDKAAAVTIEGLPQPQITPHGEQSLDAPTLTSSESSESLLKKAGDSPSGIRPQLSPTLGLSSASLRGASPGTPRRFQRVEILKIAEGTQLIEPTEVVVSQGAVLTAEPVLTPLEKLRRKDQDIHSALEEKQRLVADILHVPHEEFENIAEIAGDSEGEKEAHELVLVAIFQAKRLQAILNESLKVSEEETVSATSDASLGTEAGAAVAGGASPGAGASPRPSRKVSRMPSAPTHKLIHISNTLSSSLDQLLHIVKERDEEREKLRRELQRCREQIHVLHDARRRTPQSQSPSNSVTHSRPNSFISIGSSCDASDNVEHHGSDHEEETTNIHPSPLRTEEKPPSRTDGGESTVDRARDSAVEQIFVDAISEETTESQVSQNKEKAEEEEQKQATESDPGGAEREGGDKSTEGAGV